MRNLFSINYLIYLLLEYTKNTLYYQKNGGVLKAGIVGFFYWF